MQLNTQNGYFYIFGDKWKFRENLLVALRFKTNRSVKKLNRMNIEKTNKIVEKTAHFATMSSSGSSSGASSSSNSHLKSTIWIGNIDQRATESQVLKLVKPFGKILKFDFIYSSTASTGERVPRGFAFVTYDNYVSAGNAIQKLNGLQVCSKNLRVQTASSQAASSSHIAMLSKKGGGGQLSAPLSLTVSLDSSKKKTSISGTAKESKIKALEAKLKALSRSSEGEFKPVVADNSKSKSSISSLSKHSHSKKPYDRNS